jgi:hypothetical protein
MLTHKDQQAPTLLLPRIKRPDTATIKAIEINEVKMEPASIQRQQRTRAPVKE